MQGGLESGERYETSAKVHGLDIKVTEEFKKFGLEHRCRNICDDLGIERYDDLKWVSTEMVQEYQMKPVEREKLKALVGSYHSCQARGAPLGAGSGDAPRVLAAHHVSVPSEAALKKPGLGTPHPQHFVLSS